MSDPDGNYRQHPQQPPWDAGRPAGQYPPGAPYPTGGQYPPGVQYPTGQPAVGYPTGGQYPASGRYGQYPEGNQYPGAPPSAPADRPGQEWDPAGTQHPGADGRPPPPGYAFDQQAGTRPPSRQRRRIDPAKLFGLAVALLGGLNFVFGFLPEVSAPRSGATLSVFAVGPAYVPILLLIAGLLALAAFLPGSERSRLAVAAVSVGGAVGAIVSLGTPGSFELFANPNQVTGGLGAILLVIFGIIQAVIAVGAYVVGADTLWKPKSANEPAAPPPIPANPAGWGATGSAAGPGPIDPSLVGVYTPERPHDAGAGYQGRGGGPGWPTGADAAHQGWVQGASSGYPSSVPGYGAPGQAVTSAAGGSPSAPVYEEPATGPQMVVGLETMRVDTRKGYGDGPAESSEPSPAAPSAGDEVEIAGDPAGAPPSRDRDPEGDNSREPSAPGQQH